MTPVSAAALEALAVDTDTLFAPYNFIVKHQDDACELNLAQTQDLLALINAMPTLHVADISSTGLRLRYASRSTEGAYLFAEIDQVAENRFFVTSLVDHDLNYVAGYVPIDTFEVAA